MERKEREEKVGKRYFKRVTFERRMGGKKESMRMMLGQMTRYFSLQNTKIMFRSFVKILKNEHTQVSFY